MSRNKGRHNTGLRKKNDNKSKITNLIIASPLYPYWVHKRPSNTKKGRGRDSPPLLIFGITACDAIAPACVMNGLLVGRNDFRTPNEVLTRFGFPSVSQNVIRLPELGAGGTGSLGLSWLTTAEADHRVRLAELRGTPFMAPDATRPTGLVRQPVISPWFRGSLTQPLLPG